MTYKEITESLKCCVKRDCYNCGRLGNDIRKELECRINLMRRSLGLIARQQAKIERLKKENKILSINADTAFQDGLNYAEQMKAGIKSESVKEFAERLKNKIEIDLSCGVDSAYYLDGVLFNDIDNLAKEMVGTKNEN